MDDHVKQGEMLFSEGEVEKSEKIFLNLSEKNPEDFESFNNLGVIHYSMGNLRKAEDFFIKAISIKNDYLDALLNLSDLYKHEHREKETARNTKSADSGLNILIRGGGFINKGAEAMVKTVQREISKRIRDARFFVESPKSMEKLIESQRLNPIVENSRGRYSFIDGVIDVSGFAIGDEWGVDNTRFYQHHNSIFESFGRPVIFMPQAWGPFTNQPIRRLSASAINLSDCAYARDKRSYLYMNELEGVDKKKIRIAPDIAYQFEGAAEADAMNVLKENGLIYSGKSTIGIMPNMQVYLRTDGKGLENKYVNLLVDMAKYFLYREGLSVVLIPHQVYPFENPDVPDDRFLCDMIMTSLNNVKDVISLTGYYPAEVLKAVIGRMDFVVGSRYHGIIAALSQMVPALVLGWSHKYFELMRDVGTEEYIADYKNLNKDELLALVKKAWLKRDDLKNILQKHVPEQINKSAEPLDHAASILSDRYML